MAITSTPTPIPHTQYMTIFCLFAANNVISSIIWTYVNAAISVRCFVLVWWYGCLSEQVAGWLARVCVRISYMYVVLVICKMEAEIIIAEVKKRPVIWDSSEECYKNKAMKNDAWMAVASNVDTNFKTMSEAEQKTVSK